MTGKTHLAGGLASLAATQRLLPEFASSIPDAGLVVAGIEIPALLPAIATVLIASLLPDLDEPEALIVNAPAKAVRVKSGGRNAPASGIRIFLRGISALLGGIMRALSFVVRTLSGGHRGATHWLLTAILLTVGVFFVGRSLGLPQLWIWFLAGYASHLVLDMMTPSGLQVLRPFSRRNMHLLPGFMRVQTGGIADSVVRYILFALALMLFIGAV